MLAAQLILHFLPGKKYEKYAKMMIALVVLSQLALPVLSLGREDLEGSFWNTFSALEEENEIFSQKMALLDGMDAALAENSVVQSVEEKVSKSAGEAGVSVSGVRLKEDGVVLIQVKKEGAVSAADPVPPVAIGQIELGQETGYGSVKEADVGAQKGKMRPDLAKTFAAALGMGEEKVEVIELG